MDGLQMSNDVRMLLPILVAIGAAKVVADAVTPALYHAQLDLKVPAWPSLLIPMSKL